MSKLFLFARRHLAFVVLAALALALVLVAILAPVLAPYDYSAASFVDALQAPSLAHPFGTDKLGRDLLSRVIYGTRYSLTAALVLVVCIFVVGSILGILAGYFGGWVDTILMRFADMMVSFPGMVLAIAIAGILGASMVNAVIAITAVSWTKYARLARSLVLKVKHNDYIAAARVTGSKTTHILTAYLFPIVTPTLLVTATTDIGSMLLELAGLSFLGFGAKSPNPEWGLMLSEGRAYLQAAPWLMIFPGLAIFIVVVVFNLLGDSLRDVLDPRDTEGGA